MRLGEYELDSPLINAGGVVKTPFDVSLMAQTGVGAILAGSYTLEPRIGNSPNGETVYYHDPDTGITYNSLGMPNKGIVAVARQLPDMLDRAHRSHKPLVLNLAPVSDNPVQEVATMLGLLRMGGIRYVDGLELNASCPNVVADDGGRHELLSHHPYQLGDVLTELGKVSESSVAIGSLIVRISPFRERGEALQMAEILKATNVSAVSAFNTFPGGHPVKDGKAVLEVPGGIGGMSGPGMASQAEEQTVWLTDARTKAGASFDILASNGIHDARSMRRRLNLGAGAVSATTLFYETTDWRRGVDDLLQRFADGE